MSDITKEIQIRNAVETKLSLDLSEGLQPLEAWLTNTAELTKGPPVADYMKELGRAAVKSEKKKEQLHKIHHFLKTGERQ